MLSLERDPKRGLYYREFDNFTVCLWCYFSDKGYDKRHAVLPKRQNWVYDCGAYRALFIGAEICGADWVRGRESQLVPLACRLFSFACGVLRAYRLRAVVPERAAKFRITH